MWDERIEKLKQQRARHAQGGGTEKIERQHASGKLTAMERIGFLLDEGSFTEVRSCMETDRGADVSGTEKIYPGDGVITGWGTIDGRRVCVAAEDFTVVGGTLGAAHARKIAALQDLALDMRCPVIFLNDSGGARIGEGINALNGYGEIFQRHVRSSGVIPQICAILGPCSGGACYSPALCDFIFVVKDVSKMFITGPAVVESVLGSRPTLEELGGAQMHSEVSGVAHTLYLDERSCLEGIRKLLSYLPGNNQEACPHPALGSTLSGSDSPAKHHPLAERASRSSAEAVPLSSLVPDSARMVYDIHLVIERIMDPGEPVFEIQKHFAGNIVTGFSRLNGQVTGVIANQPLVKGGCLDCDASDKLARFIRFCDCFGIPLLTLVDVSAFLPGKEQEQKGIIRHGAKILYAYAEASVPKITVILRKAYGGAYIAMNSRSLGADLVYAWPIAEVAVMGASGAVSILNRQDIKNAPDPEARKKELELAYEERFLNPDIAQARGYVDEVILPEETRDRLINSFAFLQDKWKHARIAAGGGFGRSHGNIPL